MYNKHFFLYVLCVNIELYVLFFYVCCRPFVQDLLNGFIRYDPTSKRTLHKTHAIRHSDGAYFLYVTNRPPRGKWGDPRPGAIISDT